MKTIINKKVLLTVVYPMVICLMSILPFSLKAGNPILSDNNLRDDISSYLRDSYRQWRDGASPAALKDSDENYRDFLQNTGIEDSLINKLSNNNELVLHLFDGLKAYPTEETASICREILGVTDTYDISTFIGYGFLRITVTYDYPLRVENVFNKVMEKYASSKPSTVPPDFNNTLQTALLEEVKSGLPLSTIYGRCRIETDINTITGDVYFADYYNGGYGEMRIWNTESTAILIWDGGYPYDLWNGLWDAVKNESSGTYTSQSVEIQSWDVTYLNLHLSGYNPYKYKMVVYILVGEGWWIKPQWERSFPVGFDTQYKIWTETGGVDYTATVVAAMILPIDADVDINNYNAAKAVAVKYVESSRTGIPIIQSEPKVFVSGNTLYLDTPVSETVSVYSLTGNLLYSGVKSAGEVQIALGNIPGNFGIVKGSSGWVKKVRF